MSSRPAISILLVTSFLATAVACNGKPTPGPRGPGDEPRRAMRDRAHTPGAPAPTGPDVSKTVTLSVEIDGLARLDKRILTVLPSLFARMAQGRVLLRILPGIARKLRVTGLAVDGLDHNRASAFALMVSRKGLFGLRTQLLAAVPVRGNGKILIDGIKASYDNTIQAGWGGLELKRDGNTVAWVRIHKGYALVAPTAALLDSAHRYLVPRARKVGAGHVRVLLNARRLLAEIKPLVVQGWRMMGSDLSRVLGRGLGAWLGKHQTDLEKIGTHLASVDRLSLDLEVQTKQWRWRLDVAPIKGGPLAQWIRKQKVGANFGRGVLSPGAFLSLNDWLAPELRSLVSRLVSSLTGLQLDRLMGRLPRQVATRGLYKRKRPASLYVYRRTLRDLNLKDYRAGHRVYVMLWHVHAFRQHLAKALPPLIKAHTGLTAMALYTSNAPGLGYASVSAIADRRRHLRRYRNAVWGTLRSLNRLAAAYWKLVPADVRKLLGQKSPVQFIFRQNAARVGRTTVSAVALRIKWPVQTRRKLSPSQQSDLRKVSQIKQVLQTLFDAGDVTWAWAYVGNKLLVSAGHGWKPRMLSMVKAASGKAARVSTPPKPHPDGTLLGRVHFRATALVAACMRGLFKFVPNARRSRQLGILNTILQRDARRPGTTTRLEWRRHQGGYRIQSVLSPADVRSLGVIVGYLFYVQSSPPSHPHIRHKAAPVHIQPPPSHP